MEILFKVLASFLPFMALFFPVLFPFTHRILSSLFRTCFSSVRWRPCPFRHP